MKNKLIPCLAEQETAQVVGGHVQLQPGLGPVQPIQRIDNNHVNTHCNTSFWRISMYKYVTDDAIAKLYVT